MQPYLTHENQTHFTFFPLILRKEARYAYVATETSEVTRRRSPRDAACL